VKCPKCGFVSFPGHEQCKKCGHHFTQVSGPGEGIPPLFHHPDPQEAEPALSGPEFVLDKAELTDPERGDLDVELEPEEIPPPPPPKKREEKPPRPPSHPSGISPWQAELAERVQEYRQRRARLQKEEENPAKPLNLELGPPAPPPEEPRPKLIEFPGIQEPVGKPKSKQDVRSAPPSFGMASFESAFREDGEKQEFFSPPPPPTPEPPADTGPLEIELGSSGNSSGGAAEDDTSSTAIASMTLRFYAGLIDAGILLAGAALYTLIVWWVGGSISRQPLDIAIAGVVGAFFILFYFAGCTAMASATPGLIWTGLEVITFEGNPPTFSHCLWRGIGYLVSMAALMMGFIWAAVDAEGLTWHDRMSRTFIVPAEHQQ
jgi:uncharacterized RDD family membrane protein YckC